MKLQNKDSMETLLVKVDNKKNSSFLRKLLLKFNFVVEVKTTASSESYTFPEIVNVAGRLRSYADPSKKNSEKAIWEQVIQEKHGTP
ncbi:hypothetical protein B879_02788 [Cecembia lonarensis LW9]|uniref:Uncharacterized protein n=2 Tax=Cecembia TaxID=1187078 RepID=K1KWX2_CECL9|nr:hypothetical protein B879_02788 [Cecembia lonarensis LW9]